MMELLAHIVVRIAWIIPGASHRWARQLMAERRAGKAAVARLAAKIEGGE